MTCLRDGRIIRCVLSDYARKMAVIIPWIKRNNYGCYDRSVVFDVRRVPYRWLKIIAEG